MDTFGEIMFGTFLFVLSFFATRTFLKLRREVKKHEEEEREAAKKQQLSNDHS